MKWRICGPHAVLIQFETEAAALAAQRSLKPEGPVVDCSVAFDKLLVEFDPAARVDVADYMATFAPEKESTAAGLVMHEIPVVYDGPDLGEVAARHGLSPADVVTIHSSVLYEVALLGFAPGFPYLSGLDPRLHTPRRANPRPHVPVGSVAIGGSHTGVYSVESPGGWNLIGRTAVRLFDPARREPDDEAMFLLRPGDRVKFVPVS